MFKRILIPVVLVAVASLAQAAPLPPAGYMPDGNTSLYEHGDGAVTVEIFESGQNDNTFPGGWSFGFYFQSDPGTLITVFDPQDNYLAFALIDFNNGNVIDVEEGNYQDSFAISNDLIGFFLTTDTGTWYTDAALNPGGVDPAFSFQLATDPLTHIIGFDFGPNSISLHFVSGIRAVPEPGIVVLVGIGLIAIGLGRKRRS